MPESIEKHFPQQPPEEPEKQRKTLKEILEERKEKEILESARKIKETQEKIKEKGETIEGYQTIIKSAKKIKALCEKETVPEIFLELLFDKEKVKEGLESLKKTCLWDEERKQWNWYMNKEQELRDSDRPSSDQLLGVIAEALTGNIEGAKAMLESLKKTCLWDEEKKQWNSYMNKEQKLTNSNRHSSAQLLGVIAEALTGNIEGTKAMLESLKKTCLWDKEKKQWNSHMNEEQKLINSNRRSFDQLLGVMAEAIK